MQGGLNLPPLRKSVRFSSLKLEHLFTEQIGFVALNSWFVIGNLEKQLDNLPVYTPLEWYSVIGYQSPQKTEYFRTEYQIARIVFRIDGSLHLFGGHQSVLLHVLQRRLDFAPVIAQLPDTLFTENRCRFNDF